MRTILDEIVETKRAEIRHAAERMPIEQLRELVAAAPTPREFAAAVWGRAEDGVRAIAEMKRNSPSAGLLRDPYDPAELARGYHRHGAAALSVLTDANYFGGELSHLALARGACPLPVLRKEFIIDAYQVYEARAGGADAVLLIAEVLDGGQIAEWVELARSLGMAALVEVHDESNLTTVLDRLGPPDRNRYLLGINNRDLRLQRTDLATSERLSRLLPKGCPFVSESGIRTPADVERVRHAGACAILVGESLLKAGSPGEKLAELLKRG